ncbi:MAG: S8/S53 family peptidase, partial [Anaerolineales bacterium]|nr:S8/S53 family peptidase [Anaerolineales bacterium]
MFTKRIFLRSVLLLIILLMLSSSGAYTQESLEGKILNQVARDQGVAFNSLEIGAFDQITYSLTGITLYQAKVIDKETGDIYGVVVDKGGITQSLEDAKRAERAAYDALYGNLDPALYDLLQDKTDDEPVTVAIWLEADELAPLERPDIDYQPAAVEAGDAELPLPELHLPKALAPTEESADSYDRDALIDRVEAIRADQAGQRAAIDAYQRANVEYLAEQVVELQAPLLEDLSAQGYEPVYVSPIAPLIYVELPKSAIFPLAQREDVDTVYGPNENYDLMNSAKPTQKADIVDSWGFDGSGIDLAILEDSRIQFSNPYLNAGTTRVPADPNVDDHATGTAGMVASQHGTYQGIAQGVNLFSANATDYSDANLSAAMDWSVSQGVRIINNSWGGNDGTTTLNVHDRHLDYIVRNNARTVTVAAGNEGLGSGRVGSPARGYNMISVGNYEDDNTLTWVGDNMRSTSSFIDPSTNIEKPEVAAVGSSINSTTASSPWTGNVGSGTSYSAPMVAGEAALLMERNSTLEGWPEAVKAIIMATALHNIEGSSRLSEYDGTGGVDMRAAFRVADESWWDARSVTS